MEYLKYNISTEIYSASTQIIREQGCNGIMFTNIGDTIARVNGMVIFPGVPGTSLGDSRSVGGNLGELYEGNVTLIFDPGGANPQVEVVQKFYTKFQK